MRYSAQSGSWPDHLTRLWRRNPPLAFVGCCMLATLVIMAAALWLDPRLLNGEPLWIKPIKFATSIAVYCFTLLWILEFVNARGRGTRIAGRIIAVVFVLEMIAIVGQAARGRTSHFNNSSIEDGIIFNAMGIAISVLLITHLALTVALLRQPDQERVLVSGLRGGLAVAALGMAVAYLMVAPTADQLSQLVRGAIPERIGAHTVGAPDGGPGMMLTGWSATAGDLRVPHFFGMHAMQILPLFALWLRRRPGGDSTVRRSFVRIATLGYAGTAGLLTIQALRGQSVMQPDAPTIASFAMLIVACLAAGLIVKRRHDGTRGLAIRRDADREASPQISVQ